NTVLGLNVADYSAPSNAGGYSGGAFYAQQRFTELFSMGMRGEYFKRKDYLEGGISYEGASTVGLTLSANIKAGPLTLIPEFRFDEDSEEVFYNSSLSP